MIAIGFIAYFLIGAVAVYVGYRIDPDMDHDGYMMPASVFLLFLWPISVLTLLFIEVPRKLAKGKK